MTVCGMQSFDLTLFHLAFWSLYSSGVGQILLKGPKQKQFFVFCKNNMIANKMLFQSIFRLHAFRLGCVFLPRPKIDQKSEILMMSAFF